MEESLELMTEVYSDHSMDIGLKAMEMGMRMVYLMVYACVNGISGYMNENCSESFYKFLVEKGCCRFGRKSDDPKVRGLPINILIDY